MLQIKKLSVVSLLVLVILAITLSACSSLPRLSIGAMLASPAQAAAPAQAGTPLPSLEAYQDTLVQIYAKVSPSVVNIEVVVPASTQALQQLPFGQQTPESPSEPQRGLGSGFVWDTEGRIVTNNHVVEDAQKITVTFTDGTSAPARLVGADPNSDLAVIQVDVPSSELNPVDVADSAQVKVGQVVAAIGNPYGLSGTMTVGIISGLNRSLPVNLNSSALGQGSSYSIPDIIQTDASINPGNSGGVLVNDQGQVIGVTTAIRSNSGDNSGVGFVVPSVIVQKVVPQLIKNGKYDRPWLGISGISLNSELSKANNLDDNQQGVLVVQVTANSPADKAGLVGSDRQSTVDGQDIPVGGDVIIAVDGHVMKNFEDVVSYLFEKTQVGQEITLTVLRGGQEKSISLTLGAIPIN